MLIGTSDATTLSVEPAVSVPFLDRTYRAEVRRMEGRAMIVLIIGVILAVLVALWFLAVSIGVVLTFAYRAGRAIWQRQR